MFETARLSKATEIIIGQIHTTILAGRLTPGDRLPLKNSWVSSSR